MPRTFTEADFADAPATGRVFTDDDFAQQEEPSAIAEGAKGIARAGLRFIKGIGGAIVRAPVLDELGQPVEGITSTGAERAKQIGEAMQPAMESVAEAPGLQDRPWNDPARLASVVGEALPATAAIIGSAVLSGGATIPAVVAGGIGATEQLQRGTEENDPNAGVKAVGAGAFDAATSFLPFHIIGKIASPALKTAAGAGGFTVANPIIAAARALVTGDDPKAAAYESMRNSPVNAVQGAVTGRLAPESAAVRGRKIAAGRKAAADKAVMEAAADEAVRTAQELNDWDAAWSEAGRLDHERRLAEQRAAKNATLAPAELTGTDAPAQAAATRAMATDQALRDQNPNFPDLRMAPEDLGGNPLGQVATDNPITPRIYPKEGKMPELPDMVSSPETSAPKAALPDIERIQDFPTTGPEVGKVGVEPMLPPGRVRGNRTAPTIIPDLPGKPGLLPADPSSDLPPLAPPSDDLPPKGPDSLPEGKRRFNARRNDNGELVIERAPETPTSPQEASLPGVAEASAAPESVQPAPAAAAESTVSALLPPGRTRPKRGGPTAKQLASETANAGLADWRAGIRRNGVKVDKLLSEANTGYPAIPGLQRKSATRGWDQHLLEAESMGIPVKEHTPEEFQRLLRGKNVEATQDSMARQMEAHWISKMSQDAQDAVKLYGGVDTAVERLKTQRETLVKQGDTTAHVDKLLKEMDADQQATMFDEDPFAGQRDDEFTPSADDDFDSLFGPTAGVMNLTAMRDLPGAMLKKGAELAKKAGRKIARGNDPEGLQPIREGRTNALSGLGWELQKHVNEYDQAVKSEYKREERPDIERLANEALQGRSDARDSAEARLQSDAAMAKLAPKTRAAVKKARAFLDKTSQRLVDYGIGTDQTLSTVLGNMGIWAKRSYQVFDDPAYIETVEASPKWQEWGEKRAALEAQRGNSMTLDEARGANWSMLAKMAEEGQGRYLTNTTLGKSDLSSFKQRNEIPFWMREMMGQYADFRVNFTKSAKSNANMIANHAFQEQVHALGDGKFIFDKAPSEGYVQFPESAEYGALAGKFTTPEFKDTLQSITTPQGIGGVDEALSILNSIDRFNKTAGNFPRGTIRQLPGNLKMALSSGHLITPNTITPAGLKQLATSGKVAWSALRGRENINHAELMDDLYGRGVLDSDAVQSMQKEAVESITGPQGRVGRAMRKVPGGRKAVEAGKYVANKASEVYMTFDNFIKTNGYLAEMDLYKHKMEGDNPWTMDQLKDHAANVVKDMYPTRARMMRVAEKGRNVPLASDFLMYKSERLRNKVMLFKRIGEEWNSPDPGDRKAAYKRIAGAGMAFVGVPAAIAKWNQENGVSDEYDRNVRILMGDRLDFVKNSTLKYQEHGNGKATVLDVGYMDADQAETDAMRTMVNGNFSRDSMLEAGTNYVAEYVGGTMAMNALMGMWTGIDPNTKRPIYTEGDAIPQQIWDTVKWGFKKQEPGTFTLGRQMKEAAEGKRPVKDVAISMAGPATYRLDFADLLKSGAYQFNDVVKAQQTKVNKAKRADPKGTSAVGAEANDRIKIAFRVLGEKVKAAEIVGLTRGQIRAILKDAGFSEGDQTKILNDVWNAKELGIK